MQTFTQSFAGVQTVQYNIRGTYFTTLATNLGINVRFYKGGKLNDLGDIKGLLSGLEVNLDKGDYFDRVEIDTLGADTIMFGISTGQSRYNRSQGSVSVISNNKPAGQFNCTPITVTLTSVQFLAANATRKSLMIQNKSLTGNIWVYLSSIAGAATQLNGIKLASGQMLAPDLTHTGFVTIIGDLATNPDVTICEA